MMARRILVSAVAALAFGLGMGAAISISRTPTAGAGPVRSEQVVRSDRFWSALSVRGMSAESYDNLEDLTTSADLVVVGTIQSVERGREWFAMPADTGAESEAEGAYARFATITISIQQILGPVRTPLPDRAVVKLEAYLPRSSTLSELQANIPTERAMFFLRNKGPADSVDFYRFTNDDQGLFRDFDGRLRVSPTGEDHFLSHLDGEPFNDVLRRVVNARGAG